MPRATSPAPARATGRPAFVRLSVASGTRRVDLVLPGAVPVAELVPELARSVGLLDPAVAHAGYRLVTSAGRELVADAGLAAQGVEDGSLLTIAARIDDDPPRAYDDAAEALAVVVERDRAPWDRTAERGVLLCGVGLALGLGASGLLLQRGSALAGATAAIIAVALVAVVTLLSRLRDETGPAVTVAWLATAYAAAAGLVLGRGEDPVADLPAAGGAALAVGLGCLVGLRDGRAWLMAPVVIGAIAGAVGLLPRVVPCDPAVVASIVLVAGVLAGSATPRLALGVTGRASDVPGERPVDLVAVTTDARLAHEILLGLSATLGTLLVLVAPVSVSLGPAGTALAVLSCLVVALRTRRHRSRSEVLVGLVPAVAGLAAIAVAVLWLHPAWRPVATVVLTGSGAWLIAAVALPSRRSVRRVWLRDRAEGAATLALLPLLLVASGMFSAIRS